MKTLGIKDNFLAIESEYSSLDKSSVAIVSAPFEQTTSYGKGASLGPGAIIEASGYVEFYDDEFDSELCFDKGIAAIEPIDFYGKSGKEALDMIESQVDELLNSGKFVVTLGGEHTISIAPISAHFKKYPNMSLLHFDAHTDLRQEYEDSPYSHASALARVAEFFPPERITQVGIRALCREESEFIRESGIKTFFASAIRRGLHGRNWQKKVVDSLGDEIYITFDLDYLDPAIIPATGTPEPDGFGYAETLDIFREINRQGKKIIGFDIVELAPIQGLSHPNLTAARLVYKLLNFAFHKSEKNSSQRVLSVKEDIKAYTEDILSIENPSGDEINRYTDALLGALNSGDIRAAEPDSEGNWLVNKWVKEGILFLFRHGQLTEMSIDSSIRYFDKHTLPLRPVNISDGIRLVPGGSSIRSGCYVAKGVICMPPMYINIGAYVDEGTMIDSHALVGTCAQVGRRCHISAAAQIGGVLEPSGAKPVVIEDEVMVGGNCGIYEGVRVGRRAVLASGVILTASTKVYDMVNNKILHSTHEKTLEIPDSAVLVPGARALDGDFCRSNGLSLYSPVIIKYRDDRTDSKTALNDALR